MTDLSLEWGADLALTATGDLLTTDGSDYTRQRIVRRLFTGVRSYLWNLDYGAGLIQRIGRVARERTIQSIVRANMALEATVSPLPIPTVTVTQLAANPGMFVIAIHYTDAVTGAAIAITQEFTS